MAISYAIRKINYFEILPEYLPKSDVNQFIFLFNTIQQYQNTKNPNRFFNSGDKILYMSEIKIDTESKQIKGKLLNIRMDVFPELMDTQSDVIRDIEANETEGIIEASHFILSHKNDSLLLSLEFNQYGPRITDFINLIAFKFQNRNIFEKIDYYPYTRDDLPAYKRRINRISCVTAKVHKDNFKRINNFDNGLFDAFETANRISEAEYVTLNLSYNFQDLHGSNNIRVRIMNIIDRLIGDKTATNIFTILKIRAEDEKHNNKIKEFDLLNIWVKSEVKVEKKEKSRAIISADIFVKMQQEFQKEFGR